MAQKRNAAEINCQKYRVESDSRFPVFQQASAASSTAIRTTTFDNAERSAIPGSNSTMRCNTSTATGVQARWRADLSAKILKDDDLRNLSIHCNARWCWGRAANASSEARYFQYRLV